MPGALSMSTLLEVSQNVLYGHADLDDWPWWARMFWGLWFGIRPVSIDSIWDGASFLQLSLLFGIDGLLCWVKMTGVCSEQMAASCQWWFMVSNKQQLGMRFHSLCLNITFAEEMRWDALLLALLRFLGKSSTCFGGDVWSMEVWYSGVNVWSDT